MLIIKDANIIFEDRVEKKSLKITNGLIEKIDDFTSIDPLGCDIIDASECYLSPGFVDVHVHGGGGYSAMSENSDDIIAMAQAHAKFGTTSIVPTTLTAPIEVLRKAVNAIDAAMKNCEGANILGIHLEGPYISPYMKGAQSEADILSPKVTPPDVFFEMSDNILIMGAAVEIEGGLELGRAIRSKGIVASIAHTASDYETAYSAFMDGAFNDITHIFSACSSMKKVGNFRVAGAAEAALVTDCTAQFIGDLRHLPEGIVKIIYKCKGADMTYAISDGLEFSAMPIVENEIYRQKNGLEVICKEGVMQLADLSCLAGSIATCDKILRNLISLDIPLTDCVKMVSTTPARVVGFGDRKGKIKEGYDADLVLLDDGFNVKTVLVNGEII